MGAIESAFCEQRCPLERTEYILCVLDPFGGGGEPLGIEVEDRAAAQCEQDSANERGDDDDNSIAWGLSAF